MVRRDPSAYLSYFILERGACRQYATQHVANKLPDLTNHCFLLNSHSERLSLAPLGVFRGGIFYLLPRTFWRIGRRAAERMCVTPALNIDLLQRRLTTGLLLRRRDRQSGSPPPGERAGAPGNDFGESWWGSRETVINPKATARNACSKCPPVELAVPFCFPLSQKALAWVNASR